jgi:EmrB/QacA subfamily drug resistance transporter
MASETPGAEQRSRRELIVAFGAIMLATLLAALDQTIVAIALPRIVTELHGFSDLSWVVTAYLATSTITMPLYGRLSDIHGRRRMLLTAIGLFVLGSALCGAARSMHELIASRAIQGLGAGGLIPLAQAAIADLFPPRERGRYQGFLGVAWATASIAGPLLGGTLTDVASWRWIFYINIPLGILALVVVRRTLPATLPEQGQRIDVVGAMTLSAAIAALLLVLTWGGVLYPWTSAPVLGMAAAAAACTALFVYVETHVEHPLLSLDLFRIGPVAVASLGNVALGAVLFGVTIYVPVFVQAVLDSSATTSGIVVLALALGWDVASIPAGLLIARSGRYRVFPILGSALILIGTVGLSQLGPDSSAVAVAGALAIIGLGMGPVAQVYTVAAQNAVSVTRVGITTAMMQFFRVMGETVVVAAFGALLASRLAGELRASLGSEARRIDTDGLLHGSSLPADLAGQAQDALAAALHSVFLAIVPIAVAGLVIAFLLEERPLRSSA